jgi:cell division protein FtsI/penicillin-binding protein 2
MKKRIISLTSAIILIFSGICGRIGYIIFSNNFLASSSYNSYVLTIDSLAPTLYYNDLNKITNNSYSYVAVIRPNAKCINEVYNLFSGDERQDIIDELKKGYPVIKAVDENKINRVKNIEIYKTTNSNNTCSQLIDIKSSGLLKYLDNQIGSRKISFSVDANGRLLDGDNGNVIDENYDTMQGLKLSINKKIQDITYNACSEMKSGCAIVMDITDSSILACVTKPDSSYINKPFEEYSVGPVFKIIVTSSAIENDIDFSYFCVGSTTVGDTKYSCQSNHIHGFETLKSALANSCNCYFVNLALKLGADKIIDTSKKLGFNSAINIYDEWDINSSTLPTESELSSKGELALLGFGQGKLTSTPLQICSSLCTIANNGEYNVPRLVISQLDDEGNQSNIKYPDSKKVLDTDTCDTLLSYLKYVVTNGTGTNAQSSSNQSAGKTATAQTGQYIDGVEQLNTWFAGVYPVDNPKYAIVVMTENGTSGAENCCPIYRSIVENLDIL